MISDKHNSSPNEITIPQKYLDKIVKMQQDQDRSRQEEYSLLKEYLAQMNILLDQLIRVSESGSTVAAGKKIVPFHTGSQAVGQLIIPPSINTPPPNPDDYPTRIDVYSINDNRVIPHMTLINDGPGEIFFINAYAKNVFNEREGHLNVNDQRELFNVYEVRLRSTLPQTTFRLIEGIFRTGSFAPNTVANTTIRPSIQPNEKLKAFTLEFDLALPITINVPDPATFPTIFPVPAFQSPLPPGQTASFVDSETGIQMPFIIPPGFIAETFAFFANTSTDCTLRVFLEVIPGTGIYTVLVTLPFTNRGLVTNFVPNLSQFNTQLADPFGAPPPGRGVIITITNDDPFNNMIGFVASSTILRQLTVVS